MIPANLKRNYTQAIHNDHPNVDQPDKETPGPKRHKMSSTQPLEQALEALSNDSINGHQVLAIIREFGVIAPASHLNKVFEDIGPEGITESDWKLLLNMSCKDLLLEIVPRIPEHFRTTDICQLVGKKRPDCINHFTPAVRKEILFNISLDATVFSHLNEEEKTLQLCELALSQDENNILHIPKTLLDQHPQLLDHIRKVKDKALFLQRLDNRFKTYGFMLSFGNLKDQENSQQIYENLFQNLPPDLKENKQFFLDFCQKDGRALEYVPGKFHSDHLYQLAVNSHPMAIAFVPSSAKNYNALCQKAIEQDGLALTGMTPDIDLGYQFYLDACKNRMHGWASHNKKHILDIVPKSYRTMELCRATLRTRTDFIDFSWPGCLPEELIHDPDIMVNAVRINPEVLEHMPESVWNETFLERITDHVVTHLNILPETLKTPEFYRRLATSCTTNFTKPLPYIPADALTLELCQMVLTRAHPESQKVLAAYQRIKWSDARLPLVSSNVLPYLHAGEKLWLLSQSELDSCSRQQLTDSLLAHQSPLPAEPLFPCPFDRLYESVNPLERVVDNPFLPELLRAAYNAANLLPPMARDGEKLFDYATSNTREESPVMPDSEPLMQLINAAPLEEPGRIGGRTLKVSVNGDTFFYKFQRIGESLTTLQGEGLAHEYMRSSGIRQSLKSDMPCQPAFFKLPAETLKQLPQFQDSPLITEDSQGKQWVNIYRYQAPPEYGTYAHQPDVNADDPCARPEQGLLSGAHDIGRFTGMGLVPTSTMPAYHDTGSGRRWVALHALLGFPNKCASPGTFGAWNTVSTEHPDLGYTGFRDVFDIECFGHIQSYVRQKDTSSTCHPPAVMQWVMLANGCIENLLAAVLLRSRLRQQFPEYHYKNPEALQQARLFLEQVMTAFIQGYFRKPQPADSPLPEDLQTFMGLNDSDYQSWLQRSALELVYWTAAQPAAETPDTPAFQGADFQATEYDHSDCYALHIRRNKHLSTALYPVEKTWLQYPRDFFNVDKKLNIGCNNRAFPLTTLVRGLTVLTTRILEKTPLPDSPEFRSLESIISQKLLV